MAALTPTKVYGGEFGGDVREYVFTCTPTTASDTITFVAATAGFSTIVGIKSVQVVTGTAAGFQSASASFSGLVVTLVTYNGAGAAATTWGNVTITMLVKD